jgi:acetyl-CoA carboxylase biotin carboxylase subunit
MGEAALRIARAAGYYNVGTVEFLADAKGSFYFLEVNTRLQVEHPVTELVTGLDLVDLQFKIAAGGRLPFAQSDIRWQGWAMECRICAEDPENNFFPSPGKIVQLREPGGPGIRLDSGVYPGWTVPLEYDPLLAKLVAYGADREAAIRRLLRALDEYAIAGLQTNIALFRELLSDEEFRAGRLHTGFVADYFARRKARPELTEGTTFAAALAAVSASKNGNGSKNAGGKVSGSTAASSAWLNEGRKQLFR